MSKDIQIQNEELHGEIKRLRTLIYDAYVEGWNDSSKGLSLHEAYFHSETAKKVQENLKLVFGNEWKSMRTRMEAAVNGTDKVQQAIEEFTKDSSSD